MPKRSSAGIKKHKISVVDDEADVDDDNETDNEKDELKILEKNEVSMHSEFVNDESEEEISDDETENQDQQEEDEQSQEEKSQYSNHINLTGSQVAENLVDEFHQMNIIGDEKNFEYYFIHNHALALWTKLDANILDLIISNFMRRANACCAPPDIQGNILKFFGITEEEFNILTSENVRVKYKPKYHLGVVEYSLYYHNIKNLISSSFEYQEHSALVSKLHAFIDTICEFLKVLIKANNFYKDEYDPPNIYNIDAVDMSQLSQLHRSVLFVFRNLRESKFQRYKDFVYEEIVIKLYETIDGDRFYHAKLNNYFENNENVPIDLIEQESGNFTIQGYTSTKAWQAVKTIKEYVHEIISKDGDFFQWCQSNIASYDTVTEYLKSCVDQDFPDVKPNFNLRSFNNCILDTTFRNVKYYAFFDPENELPKNITACKYFPTEFPLEYFTSNHWYHIPTPAFEKILDDQKFSPSTKQIVYMMFGKILYPLNKHDKHHTILFGIGKGGTGKSTVGNVAASFYPTEEVAILSSNIEEMFGLDAIYQKRLFICQEVTQKWKLPIADTLSIFSGDNVNIASKHMTAKSVKWYVPGMIFGNEFANWIDMAGQFARRVLTLEFNHTVIPDENMPNRLQEELPAMIFKSQRAYEVFQNTAADEALWARVPKYFLDVREKYMRDLNPVKDFIYNSDEFLILKDSETLSLPWSSFYQRFRAYARSKGQLETLPTATQMEDVLTEIGIVIKKQNNSKMLFGITVKSDSVQTLEFEAKLDDETFAIAGKEFYEFLQRLPPKVFNNTVKQCTSNFATCHQTAVMQYN